MLDIQQESTRTAFDETRGDAGQGELESASFATICHPSLLKKEKLSRDGGIAEVCTANVSMCTEQS